MRGRKSPPLDSPAPPAHAPLTFDALAHGYLQDYVLQQYRTLNTARPRVDHLRGFFGGWPVDAITADAVREYQLHRRGQHAAAATINRETSALSRIFQLAIRRGQLDRMPLFPNRLEEHPPRQGFFEQAEYLQVRAELPPSFQDVLDFAYDSGWRRNEVLHLVWGEVDLLGGGHSPVAHALEDAGRARVAHLTAAPRGVGSPRAPGHIAGDPRVCARWRARPCLADGSPGRLSARPGAASSDA